MDGSIRRRRSCRLVSLALLVFVSLVLPLDAAADGGDTALIHACVLRGANLVRIVDATETCHRAEVPMHWPASAPSPSAPGGFVVVDGNGVEVGKVIDLVAFWAVVALERNGRNYILMASPTVLQGRFAPESGDPMVVVYYLTSNCTGPRYSRADSPWLFEYTFRFVDAPGVTYVRDLNDTPVEATTASYRTGADCFTTSSVSGKPMVPLAPLDLSGLQPTFSVR